MQKLKGMRTRVAIGTAGAGLMLLSGVPSVLAANDPEARFRGAPTYDLTVTNVIWEAGTKAYSTVSFDLSWGHSWRAKWTEPAASSVTGKDLEVESWDAVWIFVKFLPEKETRASIERNYWRHATLAAAASDHTMPAGATNSVKLADDGSRGMGVFIYRDAPGAGASTFKGVKLRWLHDADKVDPARAAIAVFPIAMVYVPEGPFKVGSGGASGFAPFPDGPTFPMARTDRIHIRHEEGSLTDGSWRGGAVIPMLVDAEWNGPASAGRRARRIGTAAGQLWCTLTYPEVGVGLNYIGSTGALPAEYPTGYEAFYCMKYDVTQGQYVDFLNTLPPDVAAGRAFVADEIGCDYPLGNDDYIQEIDLGPDYLPRKLRETAGLTITSSALVSEGRATGVLKPKRIEDEGPADISEGIIPDAVGNLLGEVDRKNQEEKARQQTQKPPVYSARLPFRSCSGINRTDMYAFAVWAGLRPMSELEFEKACRGPRNPVPFENNTGTTQGSPADVVKDIVDKGLPTERFSRGNSAGSYGSPLTVFRVGCFATPTSDRVSAGATYWGILEFGAQMVSVLRRDFRGSHGDGNMPAGKAGGSIARHMAPLAGPADWPPKLGGRGLNGRGWINTEYMNGRFVWNRCRLVVSAGNRAAATAIASPAPVAAPSPSTSGAGRGADMIKVTNVKVEPVNKDYSTVSFDLAWNQSWRAAWTEPAERNVTGKPLRLENWDAAWVFIKFRPEGSNGFAHASLSALDSDHRVPAGATLDVGLSDDGSRGIGVFVYRSVVGSGANAFTGVKVRWLHGTDKVDPTKTSVVPHVIGMVYVPAGSFQSRVPWETSLTTIRTADATREGGYRVATNMPVHAVFPNGYTAFYSTKFAITQGQYADYLNALEPGQARANYPGFYGINRFTIRCDTNTGVYAADRPDLGCNFLTWKLMLGYEAWAGLRPLTDLEYEKACRGPRAVTRSEEAWAAGMCAPAAGLPADMMANADGSFWGIRGLSLGGCVHEWPGIIFENNYGRGFKGSHGEGRPAAPADWPVACSIGGNYGDENSGDVATWVSPDDIDRTVDIGEPIIFDRTGRYGARAVRTAPPVQDAESPLQLAPLPVMSGIDVGIFTLAGSFQNAGTTPLTVELESPLPPACFPEGAAARTLTAASKATVPFKVQTVLTRAAEVSAVAGGMDWTLSVRVPGGDVLAAQLVARLMLEPVNVSLPEIGSLAGGAVELAITNAADRATALTVELSPPAGVTLTESSRRVELKARSGTRVAFPVQPQPFAVEGPSRWSYRVAVANGAPLDGETTVDLRIQSRWWVTRVLKHGPDLAGGGGGGLAALLPDTGDVFKSTVPPAGWTAGRYGTELTLSDGGGLPGRDSYVLAVTRLHAPVERDVTLDLRHLLPPKANNRFLVRAWINDTLGATVTPRVTEPAKPCRLRQGLNTVAVECRSADDAMITPGRVVLQFNDARDGLKVTDLVLDMDRR